MENMGQFFVQNNQYLEDIKMNVSYSETDFASVLQSGNFKITVSKILRSQYLRNYNYSQGE